MCTVAPGLDSTSSPPMTTLHKWIELCSRGPHSCFTDGRLSVEKERQTRMGIICIYYHSLERRTALNSSNPTPIRAHVLGHFTATGSVTEHDRVSNVQHISPI